MTTQDATDPGIAIPSNDLTDARLQIFDVSANLVEVKIEVAGMTLPLPGQRYHTERYDSARDLVVGVNGLLSRFGLVALNTRWGKIVSSTGSAWWIDEDGLAVKTAIQVREIVADKFRGTGRAKNGVVR